MDKYLYLETNLSIKDNITYMAVVMFNSIIQLQIINCFENVILIVDITRLGIQWYTSHMQNCIELFCSLNIQVSMECDGIAISV